MHRFPSKSSVSETSPNEQTQLFKDSGSVQTKEVNCTYNWIIDNFNSYIEKSDVNIVSPIFSFGTNDIKWCLIMNRDGNSKQNKDYFSLSLRLVPGIKTEAEAKFKCSILSSNKDKINIIDSVKALEFKQGKSIQRGSSRFVAASILLNDTEVFLPDNRLTINCEILVKVDRINISDNSIATQVITPEFRLSNELARIFENQRFADVTFYVTGKEFQAHKVILAAQSPVFEAMFEHDLKEKEHNRIEITDIDSEVVKEMLRFMYTGKVNNLENIAIDLLVAAEKYALETLKAMCEQVLCNSSPTVENAIKILILADIHRAKQLKAHTVDFIVMHSQGVMKTSEWSTMVQSYPHLLKELFRAVTQ